MAVIANEGNNKSFAGTPMKRVISVVFIALGAVAPAMAADAPLIVDEQAIEMASPGDWTGFYAGVGATGIAFNDSNETIGSLDGIVGFNWQAHDSFVVGAEAWLSGWRSNLDFSGISGGSEIRAGFLVTPALLAYASLGGMHFFQDGGATYAQLGLGAEYAVSDDISIDLEFKHWQEVSGAGVYRANSVSASVLWHF